MPAGPRPLVIVALSGGVDSAVAALLLQEQGYEVQGLYMSNWEEDESGYCTSARDFQDARHVCAVLGIPLHRVSFAREYRERVFRQFLDEYARGRTPNPDVLCNREIKFGACFEYARRLGGSLFATGHYARLVERAGTRVLARARDSAKDQSYFLHAVAPGLLRDVLFPLGELEKSEVRRIAHRAGLPVFDKKDSTGICFIGERPFREFLAGYLPAQPGAVETLDGQKVGEHAGLMYCTLGQRASVGGVARRAEAPWYVARKDLARNVLVVVQGHGHPALMSEGLHTEAVHWLVPFAGGRLRCEVQTRHRQQGVPCTLVADGGGAHVSFDEPQRAVTPGQYAVFYDGDVCLGGAVIAATIPVATPAAQAARRA